MNIHRYNKLNQGQEKKQARRLLIGFILMYLILYILSILIGGA